MQDKRLTPAQAIEPACIRRGDETGQIVRCGSCNGNVGVKLYRCQVHTTCTPRTALPGVQLCLACPDRLEQ